MKRLMALTLLGAAAATAAACVPGGYPMRGVPGPYGMARPYPSIYGAPPASIAVGRWDNVMLLPPATPVLVLMMDGRKAGGQFLSADAVTVKVLTPSGEVALAASDVMRVDKVPGEASRDYVNAGARGAAVGAGLVGVAALFAGHLPPARVFAGGAILGAGQSLSDTAVVRTPVTIYLASSTEVAARRRQNDGQ